MDLTFSVFLKSQVPEFSIGPEAFALLKETHPSASIRYLDTQGEFVESLSEIDIGITWRMSADDYPRSGRLKSIVTPAAGRDWVHPDPSGRVSSFHGAFHGKIMGESLLAMILHFNNGLHFQLRNQWSSKWERALPFRRRLLSGQRVLVLGYGNLGRECSVFLKRLGLEVWGTKRVLPGLSGDENLMRFDEVLGRLGDFDHVVSLLPGDESTRGLIGREHFRAMKRSAVFYSLGRGLAIREVELVEALREGEIAGAGLDVFEVEPLAADSPLWSMGNVLITPHVSACYSDYGRLFVEELVSNVLPMILEY
ncbi:MAG: D-2-hydroxyacid dehydrogenase (NADP+) [Candidatus Pelagisphaera sp.]|jgi:D-2-hydroxyacid dehydrogenase (NADP+)